MRHLLVEFFEMFAQAVIKPLLHNYLPNHNIVKVMAKMILENSAKVFPFYVLQWVKSLLLVK